MLETVPQIVAEALAVGAVAGMQDSAKTAVVEAYQRLKGLVSGRYGQVDVTPVERRPDSQHRRDEFAEDLQAAGGGQDTDLLAAAQALIAAVRAHEAAAGAAVGVDLERVEAAALRIRNVDAAGTGVRGIGLRVDGPIEIDSIRAGSHERQHPPSASR